MATEYVVVKYQDIGDGNQTTFLGTHTKTGWTTEFPDADIFTSEGKARKACLAAGIGGDIVANYGLENEETVRQM